jgi:hypothetical protein
MNQSQKEFEAWAEKLYGKANIELINGHYVKNSVAHDWYVWQAARAALVVELPNYYEFDTVSAFCSDVEDRLETAGVKYK